METVATPISAFNLREPIPGYVLSERLGAGGFGEVWRAEAPGGLSKAVKIVFGALNGDRADRERKALERIKEVRHPMLLSLERIEIVHEHLVIVTELADASLREVLDARVAAGYAGVPRDVLLDYLRDAADALDYLYEHHSLQHLDIKPENLLLVADRVKVADFGLVRDLSETAASLIGGLTPLYAAPEVFNGTADPRSDQYSLAIVYQELLTGQPPFEGRTLAQLAMQHIHSQPVLDSLPGCDRPVIRRALSKTPDQRYANCRALVDELTRANDTSHPTRRRSASPESGRPAEGAKDAGVERDTHTTGSTDLGDRTLPACVEVTQRGALSVEPRDACFMPTVFIAAGGIAARIMQSLRRRIARSYGDLNEMPALQFRLFDTDASSIRSWLRCERDASHHRDAVYLPLRESKDYRSDSQELLEWLGRRWLYNIPRSRRTEGIRPLGRLAFVDNFKEVQEALKLALESAMERESITATTRHMGLPFESRQVRVFLVASTSGGTGGGMALDLGYAVRQAMSELDISDEHVYGVLAHGAARGEKSRDLATANTVSCLSELAHFSSSGYPGEPACGLASSDQSSPFRYTYMVHVGDQSGEDEFSLALDSVADYLYENTVSGAAAFFDKYRLQTSKEDPTQTHPTLRSFGACRVDASQIDLVEILLAGKRLIDQWTTGEGCSRGAHPPLDDEQLKALTLDHGGLRDLSLARIAHDAADQLEKTTQKSPDKLLKRIVADAWRNSEGDDVTARWQSAIEAIDRSFEHGAENQGQSDDIPPLGVLLDERLRYMWNAPWKRYIGWLAGAVNTPGLRLPAAHHIADWFEQHVSRENKRAAESLADLEQSRQALLCDFVRQDLDGDTEEADRTPRPKPQEALAKYARLQWDIVTHQAAIKVLAMIERRIEVSLERLDDLTNRLRKLAEELGSLAVQYTNDTPSSRSSRTGNRDESTSFAEKLEAERTILQKMDQQLAQVQLGKTWLLSSGEADEEAAIRRLRSVLNAAAQAILTTDDNPSDVAEESPSLDPKGIRDSFRKARPRLLDNGGGTGLLLVTPDELSDLTKVQEQTGQDVTTVIAEDSPLTACQEADSIPLIDALFRLANSRQDLLDMAGRLHTRIDVEWESINVE